MKEEKMTPEVSITANKRCRVISSVSQSMNVLDLSSKEKSAKPSRRLSIPTKTPVSSVSKSIGNITLISEIRTMRSIYSQGLVGAVALPYLGIQVGELNLDEKAEVLLVDQGLATAAVLGVLYSLTSFQPLPDDVFRYGTNFISSALANCLKRPAVNTHGSGKMIKESPFGQQLPRVLSIDSFHCANYENNSFSVRCSLLKADTIIVLECVLSLRWPSTESQFVSEWDSTHINHAVSFGLYPSFGDQFARKIPTSKGWGARKLLLLL